MKRILLRSTKDPFDVVSAETTLRRNLIAENAGNLLFMAASYKLLATPEVEVVADRLRVDPRRADEINERYDAYVIPLANAFRPRFEANLVRLTRLIERLRIPVVVLGVGADANVRYDLEPLRPIEPSVRAFVRAVLARSGSIGVRGELTETYLRGLGFRDVEVIGCPSMFLDGDRIAVEKRVAALDRESAVSINVSPYVRAMGEVVMSTYARYPNLTYVAQDIDTLALLLWGEAKSDATATSKLPIHRSHPLVARNRTKFYVDPWPWIRDLRAAEFAFGTRIHGNIAALLGGTPAFLLAHDARTLELARYHAIPHRLLVDVPGDVDAGDLFAEADYGPLNRGHAERFARFAAYLERHGLDHAFAHPDGGAAFDARVAETAYPPPVDCRGALDDTIGVRLNRLRYHLVRRARRSALGAARRRLRSVGARGATTRPAG
ncbi:MAG TPA: polysaccharide pyruvyl transferase family protein [Candidatus Limnocylindrales bacterium]|nr:polysaccharide pyruvyl transferase family protein [Candidatus Limnocylindrales bacterium]